MVHTPIEAIVTVAHAIDEGWHTFTSDQVPGLFLTGREEDLPDLYEAVLGIIAELAKADFGMEVVVSPEMTFSSYSDTLPPTHQPPVRHFSVRRQAA